MTPSITKQATPRAPSSPSRPSKARIQHELPAWDIVREVHAGQSAVVYRARPRKGPPDCPADYAIKVLTGDMSQHRLQQFRREAWIGRQLQQEHLVPVFSAHCRANTYYLVMPFLSGVSVQRLLARAVHLPLGRAVWTARQASEALLQLHAAKWLHGDVKPANLLLSRSGHATLVDLGFARQAQTVAHASGPLLGSVAYAAPELFATGAVGTPADMYSLAIALFEMITGRLPFEGNTPEELANAHLSHTPADVRDFDPLVPKSIAWLLRRALAKQPLRRPSAQEMRDTLAENEIELLNQWFQTQAEPMP